MGKEDKIVGLPADSLNREEGYYWVMYGSEWIIAEWIFNQWWTTGENECNTMQDYDFNEIDERQVCRNQN